MIACRTSVSETAFASPVAVRSAPRPVLFSQPLPAFVDSLKQGHPERVVMSPAQKETTVPPLPPEAS